jgi:uncharacterized protein YecE (DUF72 family)
MHIYAGTSGYSYKEWKGSFYPEKLPAKEMLRFYGENLPAVEVNNTFYRMPNKETVKRWAAQVAPSFRFVLKASRKITHTKPLRDKRDEVGYFLETAGALGEKLGGVLFQLPPYLHRDLDLLADFIELLPTATNAAFEFRHASWFAPDHEEELYELLGSKGLALCCADSEKEELTKLVPTADWGYLRMRRQSYSKKEIEGWAAKVKAQPWKSVFVFFKHEAKGSGPDFARAFLELSS